MRRKTLKERLEKLYCDLGDCSNDVASVDNEPIVKFAHYLLADRKLICTEEYSIPEGNKKLKRSQWRKMKRRLAKNYPENWKEIWDSDFKPHLQNNSTVKICSNDYLEWIHVAETKRSDPGRPKQVELRGVVWMLKTYFESVAKRPCWAIIAEILNHCLETDEFSASRLRSAWNKANNDFYIHFPKSVRKQAFILEQNYFQKEILKKSA